MKQLYTRSSCPLCGNSDFHHVMEVQDHMISKEVFHIVKCEKCDFHFTNPIPLESEIGNYYKHESYVSHSSSNKGVINKLYNLIRKRTLKQKVRLIQSLVSKGTVVDYGCGTGHFLNELKNVNYQVYGFEPDADARTFTQTQFGIQTQPLSSFDELRNDSIDVITMWHVLEHVYHLKRDFGKLVSKLKPGGYMVVAVPNHTSADATRYKSFWAAYDVPRHLYHFAPNDINALASEFQLTVEQILPMKFDSYYVSMLSEKYKNGNLLNAFFAGLFSNLKAKKGTYSSQIYILKSHS